jgi:hypothetical protein
MGNRIHHNCIQFQYPFSYPGFSSAISPSTLWPFIIESVDVTISSPFW